MPAQPKMLARVKNLSVLLNAVVGEIKSTSYKKTHQKMWCGEVGEGTDEV